jgi:hypothetical protein
MVNTYPATNMLEAECYGAKKRVDKGDYREAAKDRDARGVKWPIITAYN